jgi:hypothetical protein
MMMISSSPVDPNAYIISAVIEACQVTAFCLHVVTTISTVDVQCVSFIAILSTTAATGHPAAYRFSA